MVVCAQCGRESPDDFTFCPGCSAPLAPFSAREVRKVVTVLFCDLSGSTAIGERTDPEALRALMNRYYDAARTVLERHGGTVEKFVGDAVMAVFGIPVASEDDALRAIRAAVELRDGVHELGLEARIGVNTGAVVAGEGDTLVTGDAVNVAARLEQAAGAGELLLGETTLSLVRDAVQIEPLELELKGKSSSVAAYRLLALDRTAGGLARDLRRPLIGRERERERLRVDFEEVVERSACRLFTLIGPAGVGKSRLVHDFLERVAGTATIARGRALSYGEGITYWPLVEILIQLGVEPTDVIGSSPADTQLTTRALVERLAEERPLVLVVDDLHWAEPPFLDLVEHVVDWSRDRPILLLCVARPELLDVRPGWGGGKLNATSELLDPLPDDDAEALAESLLEDVDVEPGTRDRILATAEGNPLFIEEMALLARDADGTVDVPPTIQALLQARLDTLGELERAVVDRGSVEGEVFHRGAVTALAGEASRHDVPTNLLSLVRKEVVRPHRTQIPGDDAFRFRHLLIRDAAYDSLPKASRAELHERFADWLASNADLYEQDEIVGYHLEQAARYRAQLEPEDPRAAALGASAADRLARAGRAAFDREDMHATCSLLMRAIDLLPESPERRRLLPYLLHALSETRDDGFAARLDELERGDDRDQAVAVAFRCLSEVVPLEQGLAQVDDATQTLEAAGDIDGLVFCEMARAWVYWGAARAGDAHHAYRRAYQLVGGGGSGGLRRQLLGQLVQTALFVGLSVDEVAALIDELDQDSAGLGPMRAATLDGLRARNDYLAGAVDADRVREVVGAQIELLQQTGSVHQAEWLRLFVECQVPWLEGDDVACERAYRDCIERTERLFPELYLANVLGEWAIAACALGDHDGAIAAVERGRSIADPNDVADQVVLDLAEASARSLRGEHERARALCARARSTEVDVDLVSVTNRVEWVEAGIEARARNAVRARALLADLVDWAEGCGRLRVARRYRRDLEALG